MKKPIISANSKATTIMWEDGTTDVIQVSDFKSREAFEYLKKGQYDELYKYLHGNTNSIFQTNSSLLKIDIVNEVVYFKGEPIESKFVINKIIQIYNSGGMITPVENFLEKVYKNPSKTAVDELFLFVEETNMSLFEDGDIAAYKMVRSDYRDIYSNTCDYSIGKEVVMPRNKVNDNRNQTCSDGLHFCSKGYLPAAYSFSGNNRMILVKINPEDVVCIPSDYNNQKARACKITSYRDITNYDEISEIYEKYAVVDNNIHPQDHSEWWSSDDSDDLEDYEDDDYDCNGDCDDCDCHDEETALDEQSIDNHIQITDDESIFREDSLSKDSQKFSGFWQHDPNKPELE